MYCLLYNNYLTTLFTNTIFKGLHSNHYLEQHSFSAARVSRKKSRMTFTEKTLVNKFILINICTSRKFIHKCTHQ